jgi:hypothetical protein
VERRGGVEGEGEDVPGERRPGEERRERLLRQPEELEHWCVRALDGPVTGDEHAWELQRLERAVAEGEGALERRALEPGARGRVAGRHE